ncbi:hypothetical protein [cyanobacterium endosymbiont of Rhopalodia gibberula]|nr:hypothetical protein [cyanobacterium endosymbiont of Rhopalodia gibberula]
MSKKLSLRVTLVISSSSGMGKAITHCLATGSYCLAICACS